jgi:hypothetical protein
VSLPYKIPEFSAHAIFCDEIRQEANGKLQFIGIYANQLRVPQFPFQLPSLKIVAITKTPVVRPVQVHSLRLEFAGAVVMEQQVPQIEPPEGDAEAPTFVVNHFLHLQDYVFEGAGILRVLVDTDSGVFSVGGIKVEAATVGNQQVMVPALIDFLARCVQLSEKEKADPKASWEDLLRGLKALIPESLISLEKDSQLQIKYGPSALMYFFQGGSPNSNDVLLTYKNEQLVFEVVYAGRNLMLLQLTDPEQLPLDEMPELIVADTQ